MITISFVLVALMHSTLYPVVGHPLFTCYIVPYLLIDVNLVIEIMICTQVCRTMAVGLGTSHAFVDVNQRRSVF